MAVAGTIEVTGLHARDLDRLRRAPLSKPEWAALLAIHSGPADTPAMLGSYEVTAGTIVFRPRFPLVPGLPYTVRFDPSRIEGNGPPIETIVTFPKAPANAATVVANVYPSADELPANQLKFYLDFSAPMSTGDAYQHIRLLDETGREVPRAFLQTAHELWDERRQRFTLILDPGRIKRGLRANLEDGAPVQTGQHYRLTIDPRWRDGDGNPLREPFEKRFRVIGADRAAPNHRAWRITTPTAGTTEPLRIDFNEPLDRALLEDMLVVLDDHAQRVPGQVDITAAETQWLFRPSQPWRAGNYVVQVNTKLEDLAGNNLRRLFDEDVSDGAQTNAATSIDLLFKIR
ncbi:MAG: Ig-like domain-containing protein [Acidobacteriota bacterium]|nr:Ig-like domain-containing protein [Acidobacteriota bacterium]